jgi:putative SOS response-associated peptidase YedK
MDACTVTPSRFRFPVPDAHEAAEGSQAACADPGTLPCMCYSAQVSQSLKEYLRLIGAVADLAQIETILERRLTDSAVRIPRGFERNFDHPNSEQEQRIRALLDRHRDENVTRLEQEVFTQKKRLADAQRKLKEKETKSARNEERIASNKIETALGKLALLKGTQPHRNDDRIFPMSYAPIVVEVGGKRLVRLARYHLRQAGTPASIDRKYPGLYNARRDNLEKFWRQQFTHKHALMLTTSFFENVDREGKNVVLHFKPQPAQLMWIACLYDEWQDPKDGTSLLSFAAVTDEPPDEVRAAGHDRMIINIQPTNADRWLNPARCTSDELQSILTDRQAPYYEHVVAAA